MRPGKSEAEPRPDTMRPRSRPKKLWPRPNSVRPRPEMLYKFKNTVYEYVHSNN